MDDDLAFVLFLAWAVVFVLFLHDMAQSPATAHHRPARVPHYAPCGTPEARFDGDPITYDDVYEAEHDLCNTRRFPYCHALPIPFNRQLDETYFDVWPDLGCARDLVPDAGCVQEMPEAVWTRGPDTFTENDTGCIAP